MWINPEMRQEIQCQLREKWLKVISIETQPDRSDEGMDAQTNSSQDGSSGKVAREQDCVGLTVLDELVALLVANHDQPVESLRPQIQRLVLEHLFLDQAGDRVMCHDTPSLEMQVDLIIRVLQQARRQALVQGQYSNQPSTPPMFG